MPDEIRNHRPITEGVCWCSLSHHCCHLNQNIDEPSNEEICCMCGEVLPIGKLANEKHGPWAWWLYIPQKVPPEADICKGLKQPPVRVIPPDAHERRAPLLKVA